MNNQKFVTYWLGYHKNPPSLDSLPEGIDVINLFLLGLATSANGSTLGTTFITTGGYDWETILQQAAAAKKKSGVKVCVSIMSNKTLSWNNITDPDQFALNVYNLITEWGLDGIDIDPEQSENRVSIAPNQNFIAVMKSLGKYFGPSSGTGLIMSYVSYVFGSDKALLTASNAYIDYLMLMGYFWTFEQMKSQFNSYSSIVGANRLFFGIGGDPWGQTSYEESIQLAKWQPASGAKGGVMEFNINDDPKYSFAEGILSALGKGTPTAA